MSHDFQTLRIRNQELADKLRCLTGSEAAPANEPLPRTVPQDADAVVAHIEVNQHHGVGVLLLRLFGDAPNVLSIRSKDFYAGRQEFGAMHVSIAHGRAPRDRVIANVLDSLGGATIRRILAVPYFADDVLNAIAIKEAFGAPLCTFLMDDQNLHSDGIPDALMDELLRKSSLRLAISPEMCEAYEAKYGQKIWFMPPVAPTRLISPRLIEIPGSELRERQPVILGNIWGQRWLELLRSTVRGTGVKLKWYNNGEFRWLNCSIDDLIQDGILPQQGSPDPDEALVETLRQAPFVVVPSGTLDESDDRKFIAQLSFPSRIPYILATSQAPLLVLGSEKTAAARIVTRLGIGMVAGYERQEFLEATKRITGPDVNLAMRRRALVHSLRFADVGALEWIWQSLEKAGPVDGRYQEIIPAASEFQTGTLRHAV